MKFVIGGLRGTAPSANTSYSAFGGDTTSYLIQSNGGDQAVVDLGSGVNNLFPYFIDEAANSSLEVFVTHFHLDHLIGLVMLPNLNGAKTDITIQARIHNEFEIEDVVNNLIKPPYWPLGIQDMSKAVKFANLDDKHGDRPKIVGDLEVRWCPQRHPGGSTAFRFDEKSTGKSLVIATDIEWQKSSDEQRQDLLDLCSTPGPIDLLVMDGQFQDDEYPNFVGWGHSALSDVITVSKASGAKQTLIAHHSPLKDDAMLRQHQGELSQINLPIRLAQQGNIIVM